MRTTRQRSARSKFVLLRFGDPTCDAGLGTMAAVRGIEAECDELATWRYGKRGVLLSGIAFLTGDRHQRIFLLDNRGCGIERFNEIQCLIAGGGDDGLADEGLFEKGDAFDLVERVFADMRRQPRGHGRVGEPE